MQQATQSEQPTEGNSTSGTLFLFQAQVVADGVIGLQLQGQLMKDPAHHVESVLHKLNIHAGGFNLVIDFATLLQAELAAAKQFFSAISKWPRLMGIYLVGQQPTFRLAVKLSTAGNPYLPVYWADSTEDALMAINSQYAQSGFSMQAQPVFGRRYDAPRFLELWNSQRDIIVHKQGKYRVVSLNDWEIRTGGQGIAVRVSVVEGSVLVVRMVGRLSRTQLIHLQQLQERVLAELEVQRPQLYVLLDLSELYVPHRDALAALPACVRHLVRGCQAGMVHPKGKQPSARMQLWLLALLAGVQLPVYQHLSEALEQVASRQVDAAAKHPLPQKRAKAKRTIRRLEQENEILENNIEVSREKLFHLIARLYQQETPETAAGSNDELYQELTQSLHLLREALTQAWEQYHEKMWQLQKNQEKALRARLDPHFIFNALNGIRQLIREQRKNEAGELLSDFADMMRLLIENSFKTATALKSEINYLKLYLKLEQMRFAERFRFDLHYPDEVAQELEQLQLPPMLLQPYLEQAIWERILPCNYAVQLQVAFGLKEGVLSCHIRDNGLSFAKARSLQNSFAKERNKQLSDVEARLRLLQEMYQCPIRIFELETRNTRGAETLSEVLIEIPQDCF